MKLYDSTNYDFYTYRTGSYKYPSYKSNVYMCCKYWNKDLAKASKLMDLLIRSNRYDKISVHKGCVYATRRLYCCEPK